MNDFESWIRGNELKQQISAETNLKPIGSVKNS